MGVEGRVEMRLYVPLHPDEVVELYNLALKERRTPQQQAALILGDALALESRSNGEPIERAGNDDSHR
jgi:hypothetical protein